LEEHNADEQRIFQRFRHREPVQYRLEDLGILDGCVANDLSESGIRIRLSAFIPFNTELTLKIRLADENIVECAARVVWIEKTRFGDYHQAGLEFLGGKSVLDHQKRICEFQSHQQQMPSLPYQKRRWN